jgi:hypothetical protein
MSVAVAAGRSKYSRLNKELKRRTARCILIAELFGVYPMLYATFLVRGITGFPFYADTFCTPTSETSRPSFSVY